MAIEHDPFLVDELSKDGDIPRADGCRQANRVPLEASTTMSVTHLGTVRMCKPDISINSLKVYYMGFHIGMETRYDDPNGMPHVFQVESTSYGLGYSWMMYIHGHNGKLV